MRFGSIDKTPFQPPATDKIHGFAETPISRQEGFRNDHGKK